MMNNYKIMKNMKKTRFLSKISSTYEILALFTHARGSDPQGGVGEKFRENRLVDTKFGVRRALSSVWFGAIVAKVHMVSIKNYSISGKIVFSGARANNFRWIIVNFLSLLKKNFSFFSFFIFGRKMRFNRKILWPTQQTSEQYTSVRA